MTHQSSKQKSFEWLRRGENQYSFLGPSVCHRQKMHLFLPTSCTSGMSPRMGKWCPEKRETLLRGANDLYRRAKTQKLRRQATAFKPHLSRVMAACPIVAWRVHGLSSRVLGLKVHHTTPKWRKSRGKSFLWYPTSRNGSCSSSLLYQLLV